MTALKRVGMLVAALITMGGVTELGEHLSIQGVPGFVSTARGRRRPAADAGQRCRRRAADGAA